MLTVTVSSTDLYRLAATYYGDATQWRLIAEQNGLTDPVVLQPITLQIPPTPKAPPNGGILQPTGSVPGGVGALFGAPFVPNSSSSSSSSSDSGSSTGTNMGGFFPAIFGV